MSISASSSAGCSAQSVGYALGLLPTRERVPSPYILALQIAEGGIAPLFILWFGYNVWPKPIVTILVVFFPILAQMCRSPCA